MATSAIIPSESLEIDRIVIGDIRPNKAGGKTVPIKYNGQNNLQIRVPRIFYPAGVVVRTDETGKSSYSLLASLKGCDTYAKERSMDSSEIGNFYNFLLDLQEKIIASAGTNSSKWFGKQRSEAVLRETFKPILNQSVEKVNGEWVPNGKYPPSLRMKISVWDGKVSMSVCDARDMDVAVTPENIEQVFAKRIEGRMVITPSIYVTGTGFGVTWRVTHAKVFAPNKVTASQAFSDIREPDAEDDEQEIEVPTIEAPSAPPVEVEVHHHEVPVPATTTTASKKKRAAVASA
jgi:hypothetical protein